MDAIPRELLRCTGSLAIPSGSYRAQKPPQGRKYEKITKKYKIPHPGGPRKYEKITEKIQKCPFHDHFCIFSVIFSYFRGPTRGGGFCIFFRNFFSYFRPWGGFCALYEPDGIATEVRELLREWPFHSESDDSLFPATPQYQVRPWNPGSAGTKWGYGLVVYGTTIVQSPKNDFSEAEICRKIPDIPQKERFPLQSQQIKDHPHPQ